MVVVVSMCFASMPSCCFPWCRSRSAARSYDKKWSDYFGSDPAACSPRINPDLDIVHPNRRCWTVFDYFAMWISIALTYHALIFPYYLLQRQLTWWQILLAIFAGSILATIPLILFGRLGSKHNVPYPIMLRRVFGIRGASLIACIRGLVAIVNCAVFNWLAGLSAARLMTIWGLDSGHMSNVFPESWGFTMKDFIPFAIMTLLNGLKGGGFNSYRYFFWFKSLIVFPFFIGILIWATIYNRGIGPLFSEFPVQETIIVSGGEPLSSNATFALNFCSAIALTFGLWLPLSFNMIDYNRVAKNKNAPILGILSMPFWATLVAFMGMVFVSLTKPIYGVYRWDLIEISASFDNRVLSSFLLVMILIATNVGNFAMNFSGFGFAMSNLWPRRISYRLGVFLVSLLSIAVLPGIFLSKSSFIYEKMPFDFHQMLYYISSLALGPAIGVFLGVFYMRFSPLLLDLPSLLCYQSLPISSSRASFVTVDDSAARQQPYWFYHGINRPAFFATAGSFLVAIPSVLSQLGIMVGGQTELPNSLNWMSVWGTYAWLTTILAGMLLVLLFSGVCGEIGEGTDILDMAVRRAKSGSYSGKRPMSWFPWRNKTDYETQSSSTPTPSMDSTTVEVSGGAYSEVMSTSAESCPKDEIVPMATVSSGERL